MITRFEVVRNQETMSIGRYPWQRLAEVGDELTLFGRSMSSDGAVQSARLYAKGRGWKIRSRKMGLLKEGFVVHFARVG